MPIHIHAVNADADPITELEARATAAEELRELLRRCTRCRHVVEHRQ